MILIARLPLKSGIAGLALIALSALPAYSQLTYPGCANVVQADFSSVVLTSNATDNTIQEPMKMALLLNGAGDVDVYFTQRAGRVRKYDGTTGVTSTLANLALPITAGFSEGLNGIALDPNFRTNNWIYIYHSIGTTWAVTRYTLAGTTLNLASAKIIWRHTANSVAQHSAGVIRFDKNGDFFITVADGDGGTNPTSFSTTNPYLAANTNSPYGKILRVRLINFPDTQTPVPGVGTTYTIPAGNLFVQGTALTLPEIYVMGTRNPYTIDFDAGRNAMVWGDVGPDNFAGGSTNPAEWTEEHNFTTTAGNFGWPFWAGPQTQVRTGGGTTAAPVNNDATNTGLTTLPPARAPLHPFARACAITGPVYYYDGALASTIKFPPHFNGNWIVGDFNNEWVDVLGLNAGGTAITATQRIITTGNATTLNALMELQIGPDGALYVMNYSGYRSFDTRSGILRIEYNGTCRPSTSTRNVERSQPVAEFDGVQLMVNRSGFHSFEVRDLSGRLEMSRNGEGISRYNLGEIRTSGMHLLTVKTPDGVLNRKFVR